jgi:tRNA 2-selenouridine synthase
MSQKINLANVAQLANFDEVIDVRSEAEFAEDHVPAACNLPVLNNAERHEVGCLHKQVSPFAAKRRGAALVAANIARHLDTALADRPREWRPLVYCWRGGKRSGAMRQVLREVGWDAHALDGGYKAYRRHVVAELAQQPERFRFQIVCGETGSGKSRLLAALRAAGAQVLDLEDLARHRGSVLGDLPNQVQPSQKMFESLLWRALGEFDPTRAVFVESESKKIGRIQVPEALITRMWQSPCVRLAIPLEQRVRLLLQDYQHFLTDPIALGRQLDCLLRLHGQTTIERWKGQAIAGDFPPMVAELLQKHYDPSYLRSIDRHFPAYRDSPPQACDPLDPVALADLARRVAAAAG